MAWILLSAAIVFEIAWALSLKATAGYSKLLPSLINFLIAVCGVLTFSRAIEIIPTNIAYAIWVGISMVLIVIFSHYIYGEVITYYKLLFFALILVGAVGLKLSA